MATELQTNTNFVVSAGLGGEGGTGFLNYVSEIKTVSLLHK